MGHREEALVNLGRAKEGDSRALALAQVYATLAVLDAVDALNDTLNSTSE
ncbi:hypothetical protein GCM10007368_14000 [Isoptericola cucumis]|uniref:Tetratricopeptide repeat protein n=1 Tax=Isoptericola cucumis TaxID=1776856 RepID=A0ABQ2B5X8_9MICO|nr:hypothetical protein GCM10007368_14000 [Isoptericola cucumis]